MLGVFFVAVIHPSGSFESAMECMCAQTIIRKNFGGMESEPMLAPREKSPLLEEFSPEEYGTHGAASSRTASPSHYQRAILAPQ